MVYDAEIVRHLFDALLPISSIKISRHIVVPSIIQPAAAFFVQF
jgi:hypothetical protein